MSASTATSPTPSLYPILLMMIAMVSMPSGAALAKSLFPMVGAQGTAALRLLFSALMLLAYFRPWRVRLTPSGWRVVLAYGLSLGMMNLLFYMSLRTIPLGIAVALEFTGPLTVALLSSRRFADFCWIILAAVGILLLIPRGAEVHTLDPTGMLLALGAGLCWALYIVFGRRAGLHHGTQTVALASTVATVVVLPFGFAQAGTGLFALEVLPWALGVAVLSSALPYALEITVLSRIPVRVFGTLLSLEPVFAAFSGMLFLRETLSLTQWAAIVAIVAASIGITVGNRQPAKARPKSKR
ncbi:threonine/homoserine exporter RhtA [Bordetella genomosp. 4]|uniref:Threonine/homoserine exporter RhtA n=1 Tax=Bordetella genomosp. 4 TaxID=463044 RepID=A0A261TUM0_9BORD|nr:threonine/homoserine exporter RhtA [Bordetella genomosp. 4]OZI45210.1 threonine/homoserine exporter RhtA [Bordetella genomosp. 4]OZI53105.1 threonine/homoserine exporter RhtA [Bordetella genomosp. 4]